MPPVWRTPGAAAAVRGRLFGGVQSKCQPIAVARTQHGVEHAQRAVHLRVGDVRDLQDRAAACAARPGDVAGLQVLQVHGGAQHRGVGLEQRVERRDLECVDAGAQCGFFGGDR